MKPGDLVLCLESGWKRKRTALVYPKKGEVYTIRDMRPPLLPTEADSMFLMLEEVLNPVFDGKEAAFAAKHFRPLRDDSIQIFRELAANPKVTA